jgi:hypothetical protein
VLYDGVRQLFADNKPCKIKACNDEETRLEPAGDYVGIVFPGTAGTAYSLNLMLLSPNPDARQKALQMTLSELGPTGPDPGEWGPELEKGPLDNANMDRFWHQIQMSVFPNIASVERDVLKGLLDKTRLVPRSLDYWSNLCGSPVESMEQDTWLKEVFEPHRRRLIDRDVVRGLDLCLLMGIRDDLSPRSLLEDLSDEATFTALKGLLPVDDPISLLCIVDIATSRAQASSALAGLAEASVSRLCEAHLRRSDGLDMYVLLLALMSLVSRELGTLPGIANQPAYWRQICSWAQASLLIRSFRAVRFCADDLAKGLAQLRTAETATAELIDLRQFPLLHPSLANSKGLHAEVLGRLAIIQARATTHGFTLPGSVDFAKAVEQQTTTEPFLIHMPGPLELERLPHWTFSSLPEDFQSSLRLLSEQLTTSIVDQNWVRFVYLGPLILFDSVILDGMVELIKKAEIVDSDGESRETAIVHMAHIAYFATAQRCAALSEAILDRALQIVASWTSEKEAVAFFRMGLVATASLGDPTGRLAQYLTNLAALLPSGAASKALRGELGVLRNFIPTKDWHRLNRAEALANLAC